MRALLAAASLAAVLLPGCSGDAPRTDHREGDGPAASASPSAGISDFPDPAATAPQGPGPAPSSAGEALRERVAIGVLEGSVPTGDMPVVATDDGAPLDAALRDRLAPSGPRTTVRVEATTTSAGLPREVVTRIVRQQLPQVRACYDRGLATDPNLIGRIDLRFRISRTGSVHDPRASGDLPDAAVIACVRNIVARMSFPTPEGEPVDVSLSLSLSPAPPSPPPSSLPGAPPATPGR